MRAHKMAQTIVQGVEHPLFASLNPHERTQLFGHMRVEVFRADTPIINAGDVSDRFFLIEGGRVKVVLYTDNGDEVILGFIGPEDYFGEIGLLDGAMRSASIVAVEETVTRSLSRSEFITFLQTYPSATMQIFRALCERLRGADRRIENLATLDLAGKLLHVLEEIALHAGRRAGNGVLLPTSVTHEDLAAMVGASRARVTKTLTLLRQRHVIRSQGKQLLLIGKLRLR